MLPVEAGEAEVVPNSQFGPDSMFRIKPYTNGEAVSQTIAAAAPAVVTSATPAEVTPAASAKNTAPAPANVGTVVAVVGDTIVTGG